MHTDLGKLRLRDESDEGDYEEGDCRPSAEMDGGAVVLGSGHEDGRRRETYRADGMSP